MYIFGQHRGIRDEISEPLTDNPIKSLHEHYLTTGDDNYWNPKLMLGKALYYANQAHMWEIAHPETLNPFSNWVVTDDLLKFLVKGHATEITKFSGNIPLFNGSNQEWDRELNNKWMMYLLSENIMIGDLVFYDTGDATTEAGTTFKWEHVAVIVGWGPQTYHDVIPTDEIFPSTLGDALWMWLLSRCRVFEWKPRVVDRSGEIQYNGSRSIDNTSNQIVDMQILHINQ